MNARRPGRVPTGALALLRLFLPRGAIRDSILEDLAYEHRRLVERRGPAAADRWYWRQAVSVSARGTLDRLRGQSWGRRDPTRDPGRISVGERWSAVWGFSWRWASWPASWRPARRPEPTPAHLSGPSRPTDKEAGGVPASLSVSASFPQTYWSSSFSSTPLNSATL